MNDACLKYEVYEYTFVDLRYISHKVKPTSRFLLCKKEKVEYVCSQQYKKEHAGL